MNEKLILNARSTDPVTSHAAAELAERALPGRADRIVKALQIFSEGLTTVDLSELLAERLVCVSPVMVRLERAGQVYRAGTRISALTKCPRTVWKVLADQPSDTLQA